MSPPPEWAFDTPKNLRYNAIRTFQTNVKSALSNKNNGNISKLKIEFSSRKRSPFFTINEDGVTGSIEKESKEKRSAYYLSISRLKDIPVKMDTHVEVKNEIDILNCNGFWYVSIPEYVQPTAFDNRGKCIALDPGIKTFVAGVDLEGNDLEFGRDTKTDLNKIRECQNEAHSVISKFKDKSNKSTYWQYRAYVRAKSTFSSCVAKMKNCERTTLPDECVPDQALRHGSTPDLPDKRHGEKNSTRNHRFNEGMLSLNHFRFRKLLKAKCEVVGKSLIVCSEMYTSCTCARCNRLHLKLGSNDVFSCPHCSYTTGRDKNAAFKILRFVIGGSLQTHA